MDRVSIEIIVVLYGCKPEQSRTLCTLTRFIDELPIDYELIIYNNDLSQKVIHNSYHVVNADGNDMLAKAYNYALQRADNRGSKWLLLLDQDSSIDRKYFETLIGFMSNDDNNDYATVVPLLSHNGRIVSPESIHPILWQTKPIIQEGVYSGNITAFNSLSLVNVPFALSIGGYGTDYPLDMLDHWFYRQIARHKKQVYVLPISVEHRLSLIDNSMSIERYKGFIAAERKFVRNELTLLHYFSYKIRLLIRLVKQFVKNRDKQRAKIAVKSLFGLA